MEEAARAEAVCKAEEEHQAELARECAEMERRVRVEAVQEAHIERQRRKFEARKAAEQQQRSQARADAIAVMQGSGETTAASTLTTSIRCLACVRCREHLNNPAGCMAQVSSKATACARCQLARKSCSWSTAGRTVEVLTPVGSGTEGNGKPATKRVMQRRLRTTTNTSPRGGDKRKKACMTTEEGEDDEEEEVFGVPKAMVEEQRDVLGMLTQSLVQLSERLAASEVREVERLEIEHERLALERRQSVREDERVEMERAQLEIEQQQAKDMWWLGTFVWTPFVQGSSTGSTRRELEVTKVSEVEKGVEVDNEDEDAQGEEE